MMDIDYHWSKSIIGSLCVRSYRRIWAHTMTYGAPLLPRRVFFSLKGTNIYWRGYIYLWLCTYTLMNVLSIGNIFYMCTSIIVCSLSWYFILKGYITIFTFFSLFVYFYIYLSLYLCLIFSPILYGRVAHDIVYFNCLHGVGDVLLTTDSYFSMQGSLFFIFFPRFHLRAISFRLLSHSFSVFFYFCFILTFFIFSFLLPCSYRPSIIPCAYFLRVRSSFIYIISLQKATLRFRCLWCF